MADYSTSITVYPGHAVMDQDLKGHRVRWANRYPNGLVNARTKCGKEVWTDSWPTSWRMLCIIGMQCKVCQNWTY